jgi:hypothetical protein
MSHYPVKEWESDALKEGIRLTILDLRDEEWTDDGNVVTERKNLPGDPLGSTEVNLKGEASEFFGHRPANGYFGADSDIKETNAAHDGTNNLYRISRTVAGCDVFINIPKLKTHKKAGITCNLKNLVGINTYRNFLPHSSIGTIKDGGDQFPVKTASTGIESKLMPFIHQKILKYPGLAKLFSPFIGLGKRVFGDNTKTIRGGSWYGNDTIWRMILDINKVLFYSDAQGRMKEGTIDKAKRYISVVDGIIAGEGEGPKMPDAVRMGYLICGTNPVAVDSVCAVLMGFDPMKIPSLKNAFSVSKYKLTGFGYDDIRLVFGGKIFEMEGIPPALVKKLKPHRGWTGHLEKN